jgi:hypothetical protein
MKNYLLASKIDAVRSLKAFLKKVNIFGIILVSLCNTYSAKADINEVKLVERINHRVNERDGRIIENFPIYKLIGAWEAKINNMMITMAILPSRQTEFQEANIYTKPQFYLFDEENLQLSLIVNDNLCVTKPLTAFSENQFHVGSSFLQLVDDESVIKTLKNDFLFLDLTLPNGDSTNEDCQKVLDTIKSFAVPTNDFQNSLKLFYVQSIKNGYIPTTTLATQTFIRGKLGGVDMGTLLREFELTLLHSPQKHLSDLDVSIGLLDCSSYINLAEYLFKKNNILSIAFLPNAQSDYTARITSPDKKVYVSAIKNEQNLQLENYSTVASALTYRTVSGQSSNACDSALVSANYLLNEYDTTSFEALPSTHDGDNNINMSEYLISKSGIEKRYPLNSLVNVVGTKQNAVFAINEITATIEEAYGIPTMIQRSFKDTSRDTVVFWNNAPTYSLAFEYDKQLSQDLNVEVKKGYFVGNIPTGCRSLTTNQNRSPCSNTQTVDANYPFYTTNSLLAAYQILQRLVGQENITNTIKDPLSEELYWEVNKKLANAIDGSRESEVVKVFFKAIFENDIAKIKLATELLDTLWKDRYGAHYSIIKSFSGEMSLFPPIAEYYLSRYASKYESCLSNNAITKKISAYVDKVRYETISGLDMGTTGGYTMTNEYLINPEFSALCNDVCGTFEPQRAIASAFNKTVRNSFRYVESFMSNYTCDSQEIKSFELGLLGFHNNLKMQKYSNSVPDMVISYGY